MAVDSVPSAPFTLVRGDGFWIGRFSAMACPCEILFDTEDAALARCQMETAFAEIQRIEQKYSRYLKGNLVDRINTSRGKAIEVDDETAGLFDFAAECYDISDGLFDITTGVLRNIWRFEAKASTPSTEPTQERIEHARTRIGWDKVVWKRPFITLPAKFEIDFGGIGKEYAADRTLALLRQREAISTLVNLGGDIAAAGERLWTVGIEAPERPGGIRRTLQIREGAIATSGVTKRFIEKVGEMLGHILNPKTGWPVKHAPLSVTVAARTCTEAGFLSTLAILQGDGAEAFLKEHSSESWCYR